jgi:hypothetical protein
MAGVIANVELEIVHGYVPCKMVLWRVYFIICGASFCKALRPAKFRRSLISLAPLLPQYQPFIKLLCLPKFDCREQRFEYSLA